MKYQIISHDYMNTGGNCMVSIFQVYLDEENRTVFVSYGEGVAIMSTVNYICMEEQPEDINRVIIEEARFDDDFYDVDRLTYYDVFRDCLFKFAKEEWRHSSCRVRISDKWLPEEVLLQVSHEESTYNRDELGGYYFTDGSSVYIPTSDEDFDIIALETDYNDLHTTLVSCLGRLTDALDVNSSVMTPDDLEALRQTIRNVYHYM